MNEAPGCLRVRGLRIAYDDTVVVDGLNLDAPAGSVIALRGASGTGKSSVLAALAGLLPHTRAGQVWGSITYDGRDVGAEVPWQRAAWLGVLAQDPAGALCLSRVADELAFPLENAAVPPPEIGPRVNAIADRLDITHLLDRATSELSGGEQQRVCLAATLITEPAVVLLDEPLALLDPDAAHVIAAALRAEFTGQRTAVIVEHRARELQACGFVPDHMVLLGTVPAAPVIIPRGRPGAVVVDVVLRNVRRSDEGPVVLDDVGVQLRAGAITTLTGRNGSGKTTALLALAGLVPGQVLPSSSEAGGLNSMDVGLVFQRPENQFIAATVLDEVAYGTTLERARALLEAVGLEKLSDRNPHTLSLGQQRRLSVAAMAAHDHPVLLLDEPTFGLDETGAAAIEHLLAALRDEGRALLVATHDTGLVERLADTRLALPAPASLRTPPRPARVPDSPLARCSPVAKLGLVLTASVGLLFTTSAATAAALWALASMGVWLAGRAQLRRIVGFQLPVWWFATSTLLVNLVTRPGPALASIGTLTLTEPGLVLGLALGARTLAIGALASLFVLSTDAVAFVASAQQQAHLPARYAHALLAGYRLLEQLPAEWATIRAAHAVRKRGRTRGRDAWPAGFVRSALALLVVSLRRGGQLSEALESRGLGRAPRTVWRRMSWHWRDGVLTGVALVVGLLTTLL